MKAQAVTTCRVCANGRLEKVLDLGHQPLANLFLRQVADQEVTYPLEVFLCDICGHLQTSVMIDREAIFSDYIYFSTPNPSLSEHFQKYADDIKRRVPTWKDDLILEVASNDGILLKEFAHNPNNVLGIDPAVNIEACVPTWREFFTRDTAARIVAEKGRKAKVIMANNVITHTDDLHEIVGAMADALDDEGIIVMEAPWMGNMFENNAYDIIYHEHVTYFSVSTMIYLFTKHGLVMTDLEFHNVQGNSYRAFFKKIGHGEQSAFATEMAAKEAERGWLKPEAYLTLSRRIADSKEKLLTTLKKLKSEGKSIAGYGAAAKGNVILNYTGCGQYLDCLTDVMPSKIGLYAPGSKLIVKHRNDVNPDVFVLFAWTYKDHILAKEVDFKGEWVIPNAV